MKFRHLAWKIVFYVLGLLILAMGVAFSVNSGLGVSPVNSLPYVISLITKMDMGTWVTIVFAFYILLQILILRRKFHPIQLTQILFSTLFGYFVNLAKAILGSFTIPTYAGKLLMMAISLVLIAIGISLYIGAKLINMPMEGLTFAVSAKLPNKEFPQVKIILDTLSVCLAVILSLIFLKGLHGVREGTILTALLVGRIMKPILKVTQPFIDRFTGSQTT